MSGEAPCRSTEGALDDETDQDRGGRGAHRPRPSARRLGRGGSAADPQLGFGDKPVARQLRDYGAGRLSDMDDQGIDVAVLSLPSPGSPRIYADLDGVVEVSPGVTVPVGLALATAGIGWYYETGIQHLRMIFRRSVRPFPAVAGDRRSLGRSGAVLRRPHRQPGGDDQPATVPDRVLPRELLGRGQRHGQRAPTVSLVGHVLSLPADALSIELHSRGHGPVR